MDQRGGRIPWAIFPLKLLFLGAGGTVVDWAVYNSSLGRINR